MPELPEVETVRRLLEPAIAGRRIVAVTVRDFAGVLTSAIPGVEPAASLPGQTFTGAHRRGKYLLLPFASGLTLIVHLRMTGRLLLMCDADSPVRFERLALHLDKGHDLRFADQRKFGRVTLADDDAVADLNRRLGPEPDARELTGRSLAAALARRTGPIKGALLDQRVIAGLGNIYVDEALFRSRIHPVQRANTLTPNDCARLHNAIRHVLRTALTNQGTTFSSFANPYGEAGGNAAYLRAYGRAGLPCARCGRLLEKIVVAGRGTTFCPQCQRRPDR